VREDPGSREFWRAIARPPPSRPHHPIAIRFDRFTLARLKALAELRDTGYQTPLKQFVVERLYEQDKRGRIIRARRGRGR